jgi:hypothetical protein
MLQVWFQNRRQKDTRKRGKEGKGLEEVNGSCSQGSNSTMDRSSSEGIGPPPQRYSMAAILDSAHAHVPFPRPILPTCIMAA